MNLHKKEMPREEIERDLERVLAGSFKRSELNNKFDLAKEHSFALSFPQGKTEYYNLRLFELKTEIERNTLFGNTWVAGGCREDIHISTGHDWMIKVISIHSSLYVNDGMKGMASMWTDFERFAERYIYYLQVKGQSRQDQVKLSLSRFLSVSENTKKEVIGLLNNDFIKGKAKHNATIIIALKELGLFQTDNQTALYKAIRNEITDIGTDSGLNVYLSEHFNGTDIYAKGKKPISGDKINHFLERYKRFKKL